MSGNRFTEEAIKRGFSLFYEEYGRYPTTQEIDIYPYLPTSKTLQRRYGGVREYREALGLPISDYTKGESRTQRAKEINKRAHESEHLVYDFLVEHFGVAFVHREYFFTDDRRNRTDFFVFCKNGNFSVDTFYPADRHNLIGCLNSKQKAYTHELLLQYPVIFLQMNESIPPEVVHDIVSKKKNKLREYQHVMSFSEFKEYCKTKKPLEIKEK